MKAQELMIGDWVQNPLGAPYQVFAIHFYKINGDGDGYYGIHLKNKGAEARLEIYDLHPVPITPEILEKNGFVYNELPFARCWEQFGLSLTIGGNGYRINCGSNVALIIDSVHELQHALRLCGIEKEIVL